MNVGLHAVACVLLTLLSEQVLLYSPQLSALAGVLFATHPIHTEAVSTCYLVVIATFLSRSSDVCERKRRERERERWEE